MDDDYLTYQFDQLNRQAAIDEAVEAYKQELMDILLLEEKEAKSLTCEFQDDWYGGVEYIFNRLKEFINSGTITPRSWQSYDEKRLAHLRLFETVGIDWDTLDG